MVYRIQNGSRGGGRILPNRHAIVLQQHGQCRWAGAMNGRLIRAQTTRSQTISCKGQPPPPQTRGNTVPQRANPTQTG